MSRTQDPADDQPVEPRRWALFERSRRDRVFTGVAGGIGERWAVDPTVVRLAFVALSLAAGIGVVLYLLAFILSDDPVQSSTPSASRTSARQAVAVGLILFGTLLLLRSLGLWFGDSLVWPAALVTLGSAVIWTRGDESDRARWSRLLGRLPERSQEAVSGSGPRVRLLLGGLLILAGLWQFLRANGIQSLRGNAPLAAIAALIGVGVIVGPWSWRLGRQLTEERRQRIRSQERAEVAAHLHDSVLQTLALIQRSDDPREMATLARSQERELRTWLYGGARAVDHTLLSTAVNDAAAEIERTHRVAIDVVTVGDSRLDEPLQALVAATREAMLNAATHAGVRAVSVFVEADDAEVTAFVRDQGIGFDPVAVPPDRRGIADSIEGRMERYGGTGAVSTAPGRGTEVHLQVPRRTGQT
jgi:signal transduction histidine kinase